MKDLIKLSKYLSLVLRHKPESIGILLDNNGWTDTYKLLELINRSGNRKLVFNNVTLDDIIKTVELNDKQRFSFKNGHSYIRANQGHSIDVDLALTPIKPPLMLCHGTATRFVDSIRKQGVVSKSRQHVHLSATVKTAQKVGARHGTPTVLYIKAEEMHNDGYVFYLSDNKVWLTSHVPAKYIL